MMEKFNKKIKKVVNRERCEIVKEILKKDVEKLDLMDEIADEIIAKRDRLDSLKSGMGGTEPMKGGGSSQEDKIVKILDDLRELEEAFAYLRDETGKIDAAIKSLPDAVMIDIVERVWMFGSETIRSLGHKYNLSKDKIWRKSDVALLNLYKKLIK